MAKDSSEEVKIDYPPHLPPELHLCILDYAYDSKHSLTDPISRALLPRYRQALYRSIRLTSPTSLIKLAETIEDNPSLGSLVIELDVSECYGKGTGEALEKILPRLPSLQSFATEKFLLHLEGLVPTTLSDAFPSLTSLFYEDKSFIEDDLEVLAECKNLKRLEVRLNGYEGGGGRLSTTIDSVKALSLVNIQGAALRVEAARFVDCFPNLTGLSLFDDVLPRHSELLQHLTHAPLMLTSLTLESSRVLDNSRNPIDHLLPRFANLKHLDLGEGTMSNNLLANLQTLPQLEYLRFGPFAHSRGPSTADLLPFVRSPRLLVSLKSLVLDTIAGKIGKRVVYGDEFELIFFLDLEDGWVFPDYSCGGSEEEDAILLREEGEANGISMSGSTFTSVNVWDAWKLEEANRVILKTYETKSPEWYNCYMRHRELDGVQHHELSDLDFDSLDLENLKLVKIDLPELGSFQYTLE